MGSLDKVDRDEKTLERWKTDHPGPYMVSEKLDGVSCLLVGRETAARWRTISRASLDPFEVSPMGLQFREEGHRSARRTQERIVPSYPSDERSEPGS